MGLHTGDIAKCILTTSASVTLMGYHKVSHDEIAIPFLANTGSRMVFCIITRLLPGSQQPYVKALLAIED